MEGNLTKGPILKTLTKLAIPIMASSFLGTLYNITDMAWIGLLGAKAVAGVGVGGMFTWLSQGLVSLDGAEETVNYRTLVEDSLETSEADVQDERFLYTYVLFLRAAAIMALIYMIVRWLF